VPFFSSVEIAVYIKICMLATRLIWIVFVWSRC
jgi:hypothetical protein